MKKCMLDHVKLTYPHLNHLFSYPHFLWEICGDANPWKYLSVNSSSSGFASRQDQAKSEILSRHMVPDPPLGRFLVVVANGTCLASFS